MWASPFGKYFISSKLCVPLRKVNFPARPKKMPAKPQSPQKPVIYLITSGATTLDTTPASEEFTSVLNLVEKAVASRINLLQIREKKLSARVLYELAVRAAKFTRGSATRLLINDRADIAAAAGADGVHLTTSSLSTDIVRRAFGERMLIGVSTHSREEASKARRNKADFVVFGPVFDAASKREYGAPVGIEDLRTVCREMAPFPVIALGGITLDNVADCIRAGAHGIAAIRMLNDPQKLLQLVNEIREKFVTAMEVLK
jgi:thiamine-phosphate pyrophosphorylase